jgi:hypothetical protein
MAIKLKQLKKDAVISVEVNRDYYLMVKETLHFLFNIVPDEKQRAEAFMKLPELEFQNMQPVQRAFFTLSLLIAEIERKAVEDKLFEEDEILEPDDEGYVAPTQE